ncbi:MAG: energy transducer TonB [Bacteroidetes bacterium]|nr:energy transducer TonB [Bacteroidota bacterium]MBL7104857.1 energy transducer TonB [Bacteroidales bacterium]
MKRVVVILTVLILIFEDFSLVAQEISPPVCYGKKRLLKEFIKEEMIYPQKALQNKTEGTVVLSFIVKPDGSTTDLKITKSVSKEIDKEATRIFNKILWYPATELGKPIAYLHLFEIKFSIKKYLKLCKARGYEYFAYPYQPVDSSNTVYPLNDTDVRPKPIFTSRNYNFSSFMANNLKYPEAAFKQNISGMVKLNFVVEPSGRISNIIVEKRVGGGCTEEAIRVVKLLKWNPGLLNNKAVRTFMSLEITFDIAKQTVGGKIPTPGQVY